MRARILALSGHDPTGAAGLQADVETAAAFGVAICALPSALTVQSAADCQQVEPVCADFLGRAADELCAGFEFQALKFGLLPEEGTVRLAARLADQLSAIPVVADPVLIAGGGTAMARAPECILRELAPRVTLMTPNMAELKLLTGEKTPERGMARLHEAGCRWVLMTATDETARRRQTEIRHLLSGPDQVTEYCVPLLPGRHRGSGCTLATAIAALLAQGEAVPAAVQQAMDYCLQSLEQASEVSAGIHYPLRGPSSWLSS